jgi:hypothetical protein
VRDEQTKTKAMETRNKGPGTRNLEQRKQRKQRTKARRPTDLIVIFRHQNNVKQKKWKKAKKLI